MNIITRKTVALEVCEECLKQHRSHGLDACVQELYKGLLSRKVKFPILEYSAEFFYTKLPSHEHIQLCNHIQSLRTEGGNVMLGKILQKRLPEHYQQSIDKAVEYIGMADIWYVCDIIGERVLGFSLLHYPEKTIPELTRLSDQSNHWVIRAIGAGMHHAIKKGLSRNHVESAFKLLLTHANDKHKEIRQGIGWAAKTTAKFHPDVIGIFKHEIEDPQQVANWFRTKISIGLSRNAYAKRNNS